MQNHGKTGLIVAVIAVLMALSISFVSADSPTKAGETVLQVSNLSCGSCAKHIETELRKHKGMQEMTTDIANGRITVKHTAELSPEKLAELVTGAGYPAKVASTEAAAGPTTPGCRGCAPKDSIAKNCNGKNCTAKNCDPKNCEGKNCDVKNCDPKNCNIKNCNLKKTEAKGCDKKGCKLPAPTPEKS